MAAKPKLLPEQWQAARRYWEHDAREGYAWLVDELRLPVSAPAVRKTALRDGWIKQPDVDSGRPQAAPDMPKPSAAKVHEKTAKTAGKKRKVADENHAKVSRENHDKVSGRETIHETFDAEDEEDAECDIDRFGVLELTDKQEMFVREYMVDWNATQAAIRAGYSARSACDLGRQLLRNPRVQDAVADLASARARRLGIDAEELMRLWSVIVTLDANELTEHRRVCCPYCWGVDHQRQYTPSGLEEAIKQHERERQKRLKADEDDDIGEFPEYTDAWYDKRRPPSEDCPECFGEGVPEVFIHDTRKLSPAARAVYAGVKETREGIEVLTLSKEKAAENLARALGMFREKDVEVNFAVVSSDELTRIYEEKMAIARERQRAVLAERGLPRNDD